MASYQAALRLAKLLIPRGTLPDGVQLEGSVSKRRFLHRIRRLLSKIERKRVLRGANAAKVTTAQREMLIKLLVSFGYTDDNYLRMKKAQLPALTTNQEETPEDMEALLESISRRLKTRGHPCNQDLFCGIYSNGGCTKGFEDMESLVRWVASRYGSNWSSTLQARGTVPTSTSTSSTSSRVPYGDLLQLPGYREQVTVGLRNFIIFNVPADGNCLFHSLAAVFCPVMIQTGKTPPSHLEVRQAVI